LYVRFPTSTDFFQSYSQLEFPEPFQDALHYQFLTVFAFELLGMVIDHMVTDSGKPQPTNGTSYILPG